MSTQDAKLPYDEIRCPGIGQVINCKPEVQEFDALEQRYRVVLLGKVGRHGYKEEPYAAVERRMSIDSLGVSAWVRIDDPSETGLVIGLYMACRERFEKSTK